MGVHGLWRLIEPSGKPVPLETLENKILAVDISIWLHQAVKGFQDARGAPLPNAHLLGIYHRVCKLLYFRVKPVFVFDGGVPVLKKQTIAKRNQQKNKILNDAATIQQKLLNSLLKHSVIKNVITEKASNSIILPAKNPINKNTPESSDKDDMFKLPEPPSSSELDTTQEDSEDSSSEADYSSPTKQWDIHTIDERSEHFKSLPADIRHDILTDIKEQRKQSSWGRLHELPTESGDFSNFQMKRLLKRYSIQVSLEEAEKEMGGHSLSLGELEALLTEEGIVTTASKSTGSRIASDENKRFLLIKDVKKAMEQAKMKEEEVPQKEAINEGESNSLEIRCADNEYEKDLAAAIQLSLMDTPSTSVTSNCKDVNRYVDYLENFNDGDFESESESDNETDNSKSLLNTQAKSYMIEYSGLTPAEIDKIIQRKSTKSLILKSKNSSKSYTADIETRNKNYQESTTNMYKKQEIKLYSSVTSLDQNEDNKEIINIEKKLEYKSKPDKIPVINTDLSNSDADKNNTTLFNKELMKGNMSDNIKLATVKETADKENQLRQILEEKVVDDLVVEIMSNFDNSDFTEVNEDNLRKQGETNLGKKWNSKEMSDSDDDSDFVEVKDNSCMKSKETLQVIIDPNSNTQDDIFSDIFYMSMINNKKSIEKQEPQIIDKETNYETGNGNVDVITNKIKEQQKINEDKNIENVEEINEPDKSVKFVGKNLTVEQLNEIETELVQEQQKLIEDRNSRERMAGNITDQMYQEAQELLELFGVPYIIAPMEAEAQCAFLNDVNLTDGTITDDSDIWLFGGKTVYKNFFNQKKHVLEFHADRINHYFKLSRKQMILLAMLVGSDYTLGLQGIGPVTALEILASFPPAQNTDVSILKQHELVSGLTEFKSWLLDGRSVGLGRTTLRSKLQNVHIADGFPSLQVIQAYLQPEVETCRDSFSWGKPDVVGLIDFAREKFGWTKFKTEEILKPVIRKLNDSNIQKSIRDYFVTKHKLDVDLAEDKLSKRVKRAISKIGKTSEELALEEKSSKPKKGRKPKLSTNEKSKTTSKRKTEKSSQENAELLINKTDSLPSLKTAVKKTANLHVKEVIPQREQDKIDALKTKLKAIEVFRKSKQGPGYVKKRLRTVTDVKEEADLSESSDSS